METISNTYFYQVICNENIDEIKRCCEVLSVNAPIRCKNRGSFPPIFYPVFRKSLKIFKLLLDLGADVNSTFAGDDNEDEEHTLLEEVISIYNIEFLKTLLEKTKPQFTYNNLAMCLSSFPIKDLESLGTDWILTNSYGNNLLDTSDVNTVFSKMVNTVASRKKREYIDLKRSEYYSSKRSMTCLRKAGIEALYRPGGIGYERSKVNFKRLLASR